MSIATHDHQHFGDEFDALVHASQAHFAAIVAEHGPNLFTVDAGDLYAAYLDNLPADQRQHHTCHCCRRFIEQYGSLAVITESGHVVPAMWGTDGVPAIYRDAVAAMANHVARGRVTGVFLSKDTTWGTPQTGEWTHFAQVPRSDLVYRNRALTAGQAIAAKREDFGTLNRGLAEFSRDHVAQALTLLEADALYRAEKVIGPARWLLQLHDARNGKRGPARDNVTWLAVASAPVGFCTPRSSMVGTLLEDIAAGMDFATVKKRFDAKMHPLQYQRPQAPASAGNIAQAEKLVAELGLEPALHRRFARLEELQTIWTPTEAEKPAAKGGVFGHLQPKGEAKPAALNVPPQTITFEKFRRNVLPTAKQIEFYLPGRSLNFCAMLTAVHADAPPLLQWDSEEARNPFSWYVWNGGSMPSQWGLRSGQYVPVTGVVLKPNMWADEDRFSHQAKGVLFVLEGARDTRKAGLALFPEILKSDLHQVRATIEAYSRAGELQGDDEASANGILIGNGNENQDNVVRVTTDLGVAQYKIDRWD